MGLISTANVFHLIKSTTYIYIYLHIAPCKNNIQRQVT